MAQNSKHLHLEISDTWIDSESVQIVICTNFKYHQEFIVCNQRDIRTLDFLWQVIRVNLFIKFSIQLNKGMYLAFNICRKNNMLEVNLKMIASTDE